jgi:hypothetical protein
MLLRDERSYQAHCLDGVEDGLQVVRRVRNGAQHFRDGRLLLDELGYPILRLRSGPFFVDTLVHAEQFLGLGVGNGSTTAPAAVRDSQSRLSKPKVRSSTQCLRWVKTGPDEPETGLPKYP